MYSTILRAEVHYKRCKEEYNDAIVEVALEADQKVLLDLVEA